MQKTVFGICSNQTGELIAEITFNGWQITSNILRKIADFCGEDYYVCDMEFIYSDD